MQQSTDELRTGYAALAVTIMQFNANGIGNKLTELGEFLKRHNVKVAVIQESKLPLILLGLQASRTSPQYKRTVVKAREVVYSP